MLLTSRHEIFPTLKSPTSPDSPPIGMWQSNGREWNWMFANSDARQHLYVTSLPGFRLMWSAVAAFLRLASKMNIVWHAVCTIEANAVISTKMVSCRIVKWPPITVNVLYKKSPVCAPTNRMSSNWKLRNESYCKCRTWTMPISVAIVAWMRNWKQNEFNILSLHRENEPLTCSIEGEFTNRDLCYSQGHELRPWNQHKKQNQRDDGQHEYQDADEQSFVSAGTVHWIVMRWPFAWRQTLIHPYGWLLMRSTNATPHHIQYGSTNQRVFDGAREQEWRCILHQCADDVRSTAFEYVMRSFEATDKACMSDRCLTMRRRMQCVLRQFIAQSMRYAKGSIFRIVKCENFVFRLLNQNVQPDREIRADHVHQTETSDYFVAIDLHLLHDEGEWK